MKITCGIEVEMIWYPKSYKIEPVKADEGWIFEKADQALK